jgi:hypothetical protein
MLRLGSNPSQNNYAYEPFHLRQAEREGLTILSGILQTPCILAPRSLTRFNRRVIGGRPIQYARQKPTLSRLLIAPHSLDLAEEFHPDGIESLRWRDCFCVPRLSERCQLPWLSARRLPLL